MLGRGGAVDLWLYGCALANAALVFCDSNMPPDLELTEGSRWLFRLDKIGMTMSGLCAIHCALTPVLAIAMPLLGAHETEESFRVGLALLGVLAVGTGVLLHRSIRAVPWLVVALSLFVFMAFRERALPESMAVPAEILLSILASGALIVAHRLNSQACKSKCPTVHCGTDGGECAGS